jgi:hypothetical protein
LVSGNPSRTEAEELFKLEGKTIMILTPDAPRAEVEG